MTFFLKPLRLLAAAGIIALVATSLSKDYGETRRIRDRGHLVASLVSDQFARISRKGESLPKAKGLPDDSIQLERWLISQMDGTPTDLDHVNHELGTMAREKVVSPVMRTSMDRWSSALTRWSSAEKKKAKENPLFLGRKINFEAEGYRKIGRAYDALPLYFWSVRLLTRFIAEFPMDPQVPEAVYLLGRSYIQMRYALSSDVRSDRILNLCWELYPDSIWAKEAVFLWKSEGQSEKGVKNET